MDSRKDNAAERAQLNEEDMEKSKAARRGGGSMRAGRCGRSRQAKRKNTPRGPRKCLIRLDSDKEIKVNGLDFPWLNLAGLG